ncbi:hypothetical protein TI04_09930 [Achromatium sp. WMS2]|nr:hypothetical protein TI04_09930 [Achromatium sp. WMS2]
MFWQSRYLFRWGVFLFLVVGILTVINPQRAIAFYGSWLGKGDAVGKNNDTLVGSNLVSRQLRALRLAMAIMQLSIVIRSDRPFGRELKLVQQLGSGDVKLQDQLSSISASADTGVATVAQLRDSFSVLILPKLQPIFEDSPGTWIGEFWSGFTAVLNPFAAKATPDVRLSVARGLVESATARLYEDNLGAAVDLLARLDGAAGTFVMRWLVEANARLRLDAVYEELVDMNMQLLNNVEAAY